MNFKLLKKSHFNFIHINSDVEAAVECKLSKIFQNKILDSRIRIFETGTIIVFKNNFMNIINALSTTINMILIQERGF